jgi:hypothetical protein
VGALGTATPAAYRQRNMINRVVGWLKERRRLATRYGKLAIHFLALLGRIDREVLVDTARHCGQGKR